MSASTPFPSRTVLGPLTTVFTPPADCFNTNFFLGGYDETPDPSKQTDLQIDPYVASCVTGYQDFISGTVNLACAPTQALDLLASAGQGAIPIYSPAFNCPSGWTSAAGLSRNEAGEYSGGLAEFTQFVSPDETLTVCCPSGLSFSTISLETSFDTQAITPICVTTYSAGDVVSGTAYFDPHTCSPQVTSITLMNDYTHALPIPAVNLLRRPTDGTVDADGIPIATTPIAATSSGMPPSGSSVGNNNSGLSTGAKAGIGIGVAAAVILALVIGGLLLWKRRQPFKKVAKDDWDDKPELSGEGVRAEASGFRANDPPAELGSGSYANLHEAEGHSVLAVNSGTPAELATDRNP